jgi:hypothetical protein
MSLKNCMRWVVVSVTAAIAAVFVVVLIIENFLACDTAVKRSTPSLDGRRTVVMFAMECGATVPFNTQLSLSRAGRKFSPDNNPPFLVIEGEHDLPVTWIGEKAIAVDLPKDQRVFRSEPRVDDVAVEYR